MRSKPSRASADGTGKQAYARPELMVYGSIQQLTRDIQKTPGGFDGLYIDGVPQETTWA